jgi:7,8-dihydropterin-6-yl-methyl-4-(beta-D-ribofuranosyl)aminobenzene 5'-phosphate synthase
MKWTVLSDNRTNNDQLETEHGLSILFETEKHRRHFMSINDKAKVIVSPNAMSGKFFSKRGNLHGITAEWPKIDDDRLVLTDQTCTIAENMPGSTLCKSSHERTRAGCGSICPSGSVNGTSTISR